LCFVYEPWFIFFGEGLPWPLDTHGSKLSFYRNIFSSQYFAQKCLERVWSVNFKKANLLSLFTSKCIKIRLLIKAKKFMLYFVNHSPLTAKYHLNGPIHTWFKVKSKENSFFSKIEFLFWTRRKKNLEYLCNWFWSCGRSKALLSLSNWPWRYSTWHMSNRFF